ncbi:MAG: pyruvate/oxaloacetate carboxyltransferase [Alphaproteobacteria bacterium]|nr:pyruvate/oxaloacetate carboxyltransferase [Alphaproteobacteria bacterium]
MNVHFVDTTFRDGSQSLWASGMRTGMMEAVAEIMDEVGFAAIEVPINGIYFKKIVRDLKEDPWNLLRMLGRKMPRTVKGCMAGGFILPFEPPPPREMVELYYARVAATGAFNRAQLTANTVDQIKRTFPWIIPAFRGLGVQVMLALSYTVSPRHTDDYYAQKTRELVAFKPDAIYVKDQGGLLTVDRVRTLLPAMMQNAAGVPIELHSHCTTGLAPLVYLEALQLGIRTLHTAVPPLAQGSSQPSVLNVVRNARLMGFSARVNEGLIEEAARQLTAIARQEELPIGAPLEYDSAQYIHQVPGGVISNLRHQLAEMRMQDQLDEVLEESVRVRKDLGYPIMITPLSQFVVTQAAINIATKERYKHVIDEVILFAQGVYGEDSGYTVMDQNLKDRLLSTQRAAELASRQTSNVTLQDLRTNFGGSDVSDEEFLLRYIMKGDQEIEAMRAAGRPKQYLNSALPLMTLIEELKRHEGVRYLSLQKGRNSLVLRNQSAA